MKNTALLILLNISTLLLASCKDEAAQNYTSQGRLYLRSIMYISTGKVDLTWYYLGDDGWFVKNPKNGVNPVDINAEKQNNADNTGTYKITGNNIEIKWYTGDVNILSLKYKDDDIAEMDIGGIMMRQTGLPKGFTLNAVYQGINNGATYTFESGGAFSSKTFENGNWLSKKGNYTISGNNLILRNNDNSTTLCLIAVFGDGAIVINNSYYSPK